MVCDYRRSFRHLLKDAWGDTGGRFCGRESMLFGIGRRGDSLRADVLAAVIGWIEVALLSLPIARVSAPQGIGRGTIVDSGVSLVHSRFIEWGIQWGKTIRQKEKDLRSIISP